MLSTFTAIAEPDIESELMEPECMESECIEPDSVVVAAPVEPEVPVEPETLPVPAAVLPVLGCVVVEPVVAPVVPPVVVPAEADVLGDVLREVAPVMFAEPLVFAESVLPMPLVPIVLLIADAASHVPFTLILWPTCAVRSCVPGSSCTPAGCFLSMSMNMPADWLTQPFNSAFLPDSSSLFALLELMWVELWVLGVVAWSVVVLPDVPVLDPLVVCAIMATPNANMSVHVNRMRFTKVLLGFFCVCRRRCGWARAGIACQTATLTASRRPQAGNKGRRAGGFSVRGGPGPIQPREGPGGSYTI